RSFEVAALVQCDCTAHEAVGILDGGHRGRRSSGSRRDARKRAVTLLVLFSAATGTGVVAADRYRMRCAELRTCQRSLRLGMLRCCGEDPECHCMRGIPLPQRDAVA